MIIVRIPRALRALALAPLFVACGPDSSGDMGGETRVTDTIGTADTGQVGFDVDVGEWDGENHYLYEDFDEAPDQADNCPGIFNPDQADSDRDGIGDLCDPENDDRDGDGIPDTHDPFPDDAARPGQVNANTVYAHTSGELFYLGVKQLEVYRVGSFRFPSGTLDGRMTDIAIDRYGVMWGIGFEDVFVINPNTAECWRLATLPQEFNGLTLIPRGVIGAESDVLVGISNAGGWWRIDLVQGAGGARVVTSLIGNYGASWTSSGDAFSIEGVGTYASVKRGGAGTDQLVMVDPKTGLVTQVVGPLGSYAKVWGLAGWANRVYGFDETGDIFEIDLSTGQLIGRKSTNHQWWGAGVKTVLDGEDR